MEKRQKVKKFLEISETNRQLDMVVEQVAAQYRQRFRDAEDGLEIGDEIAERMNKTFQLIRSQILDYLESLYGELLSEDELDALITFHGSPVAVRLRELSPVILQKIMQRTAELSQEVEKTL